MDDSYEQLKAITDDVYANKRKRWANDVISILHSSGIRLRQDDGTPHSITFSVPKSRADTLVVGVRYLKRDGTYTEDTFIFSKGKDIERCYGRRIERVLPEYKGTHKQQLDG